MVDNYKMAQEKHYKYVDFYEKKDNKDKEYWGIGIENESYLMFDKFIEVDKKFMLKKHKRERYSVDYWINYKEDILANTLQKLPDKIKLPIYINGYLFQKTDFYGESTRKYTKLAEPNPNFSGKTIEQYLIETSIVYNKLFDKNMIYDGDTFEFTTYNFYKTDVKTVVKELKLIKSAFLLEMNYKLVENKPNNLDISKNYLFTDNLIYPKFNFGFAKFLTNMNNLAICNNGTYHINITLPTELDGKGNILHPDKFKKVHSNAIKAIQWFEPFLVGLYGSPDILNILNKDYAGGSLRLMLSRYIGLDIYDTEKMEKGKILNDFVYKNKKHYFNKLHENSPYIPPETIGYDFNYNKFIKHGIELRIFDYFPEEYLKDIINFIILICQHSIYNEIPDVKNDEEFQYFIIDVLKNGSKAMVSQSLRDKINIIFDSYVPNCFISSRGKPKTIIEFMNKISGKLYKMYSEFSVCKKMSPNMEPIKFIDYNSIIKNEFSLLLK